MKRNDSTGMAESKHEPDEEGFRERVDRIIERERPILDRLADEQTDTT
jgi:hypothetical protein